jgi:RNA polymerase sigma-70 factor (TIGR02943 family)
MPGQEDQNQVAERWLSQYGDHLYRYACSRVADASQAEDLLQETLISALKSFESFRGQSTEKTWLTGILRHRILDFYRKRARQWRVPDSFEGVEGSWFDQDGHWNREHSNAGMEWEPDPSHILDQKEFMETLHHCITQLPEKAAAVFVQRELEFEKTASILEDLNISESNLWVLLHRARNMLKRCIQTNWEPISETEQSSCR